MQRNTGSCCNFQYNIFEMQGDFSALLKMTRSKTGTFQPFLDGFFEKKRGNG